jgi:hypothetical protein
MAHKQTVADRIIGETSMMTRMVGTEASDDGPCPRCSGLMVDERFYDFAGDRPFQGVRCVNCGEILDPLIRVHRYQRSDSTHRSRYVGR